MTANFINNNSNMNQTISFTNSFWSKDKSGMNNLLNYIQTTHDDLDIIYKIYIERSQIENEFGQKLLLLSKKYKKSKNKSKVHDSIINELKETGESRLEYSENLNSQLSISFEQKLDEYKELLEKWIKPLEEIYNEKQDKIIESLKARENYLNKLESTRGQPTTMSESLKSQYKSLVKDVDEISQEWISIWKEACEAMEGMEEDRIDFIKGNVWEYANLASSTLIIQDKWCENIRQELEKSHFENEIKNCISLHGTGSNIPTTSDYVSEVAKELKKKRHVLPKPPMKPQRNTPQSQKTSITPIPSPSRSTRSDSTCSDDQDLNMSYQNPNQQRNHIPTREMHSNHQKQKEDLPDNQSISSFYSDTFKNNKSDSTLDRIKSNSIRRPITSESKRNITNKSSNNGGSTIARAPIKRKPLPIQNSPSENSTQDSSTLRKQKEKPERPKPEPIETLPKRNPTTDIPDELKSQPPEHSFKPSHVNPIHSEEAKTYRRQPSEYKPDAGSIRHATPRSTQIPEEESHLMTAPKSPRPMSQPVEIPIAYPEAYPRSPMMQRAPMYLPSQGYAPYYAAPQLGNPPVHIPNYRVSPQPSPSMSYANLSCASPSFAPTSPAFQHIPSRPTHYSDGRPVICWVQAKFDYSPTNPGELAFRRNNLIAIIHGNVNQEGWWSGALRNEYDNTWSNVLQVPSNFVTIIP